MSAPPGPVVAVLTGHGTGDLVPAVRCARAVVRAGGTPVLLPALAMRSEHIVEVVRRSDALLLSGGGDIDPLRYGQVPGPFLVDVDTVRDQAELAAVAAARELGHRILGICRGAQLLAVATGGTLIQDLVSAGIEGHKDPGGGYATASHPIKIEPGSLVDDLYDGIPAVNSHHHQAVDDPGLVLTPTAWSDDGVIEALEAPRMLALQWHPEVGDSATEPHLQPFQWLVQGKVQC